MTGTNWAVIQLVYGIQDRKAEAMSEKTAQAASDDGVGCGYSCNNGKKTLQTHIDGKYIKEAELDENHTHAVFSPSTEE